MGYLTPIAHPLDPSNRPKPKSAGGFIGNIFGDVGEFVTGLGALGGMALNDIVGVGKEVVTLGKGEADFYSDDVIKALPSIAKEYAKNYGSFSKFGEHLYNNPLEVVGDALAVATLGGYGVARGAQAASKLPRVADELSAAASGVKGLNDLSGTAKFANKILPGLGTADGKTNIAGYLPRLDPNTGQVRQVARHMNPTRRFFNERVLNPMLTKPIEAYRGLPEKKASVAADLARYADETQTPLIPQAKQIGNVSDHQQRLLDAADQYNAALAPNSGQKLLTRVEKPWVANMRIRKATDRLFGFHTTKFIKQRNEYMKELDDFFKGKTKSATGEVVTRRAGKWTPEEIEQFHKYAQIDPPKSYGRMTFDEIAEAMDDLPNSRLRDMPYYAEVLQPHVRRVSRMISEGADADQVGSAMRYVENLSERAVLQELIDQGIDVDHVSEAVADLRLWIDQRLSNPLMERGMLGYRQALDRSFIAHRESARSALKDQKNDILAALEEGAVDADEALNALYPGLADEFRRNVDAGGNPEELLDNALREGLAVDDKGFGLDMARKADLGGRQTPLYFPHIDPRRTKFMDFLMKRTTRGPLQGSFAYTKEIKGWLMENLSYISDPVEAYSRRVSQVTKDLETLDMVEAVFNRFGRDINKWDDVVDDVEAVMHPESARIMVSTKIHVENEISDRIARLGMKTGGGGMEGIEDAVADGLVAGIKRTEGEVLDAARKGGKLKAIPKVVADRLDNYTKVRLGWKTRMFWDAPINLWRSFVLSGSPRWVFYNLLGNVTFLKMQGGRLSDVLQYAISPKFRRAVKDLIEQSGPEASMGVTGGFMSSTTQYVTHYGAAENTAVAQLYRAAQSKKVAQAGRGFATRVRQLNEHIEDAFRSASYLQGLKNSAAKRGVKLAGVGFLRSEKGLRKLLRQGVDEDDAVRALGEVNKFFNDYNALGPWERNVIRRFISPFYSFYKHTVKLMLSFPFTDPIRATVLRQLADLGNEMNELGPIPEWLKGSVTTDNLGSTGSPLDVRFLNSRGINPFAQLDQPPWNFVAGQMNPILKTGYEQLTGRSTLTNEPFSAPDVITPFGSDQQYRINPETMTVEPVGRMAPGLIEHLLSQFPQYVVGRDVLQGIQGDAGARYSTGQVIQQPGGEEPLYPSNPIQELAQFMGISTTDYGLLNYQLRRMEETQDALKGLLNKNPQLFSGA